MININFRVLTLLLVWNNALSWAATAVICKQLMINLCYIMINIYNNGQLYLNSLSIYK